MVVTFIRATSFSTRSNIISHYNNVHPNVHRALITLDETTGCDDQIPTVVSEAHREWKTMSPRRVSRATSPRALPRLVTIREVSDTGAWSIEITKSHRLPLHLSGTWFFYLAQTYHFSKQFFSIVLLFHWNNSLHSRHAIAPGIRENKRW